MKIKDLERNSDGQLPGFAWPGGYPIYYLDRENSTLCAKCATKSLDDEDGNEGFKPCAFGIHYEGAPIQCEDCNTLIESAYGDPSEEKEEN